MAVDFQSLYVLASGLYFQNRKLETVANNLANVNTTGFKKDFLSALAEPVPPSDTTPDITESRPFTSAQNFVYPVMGEREIDLSQGALIKTDNPLDVAIEGKGFFTIEVNGKIFYTRDGHFEIDKNGYLVNQNGYKVLGKNGLIKIGRKAISQLKIAKDGSIYVGSKKIAQLRVVALKNLRKVGENLFSGVPTITNNYSIIQGFLEGSNVNPVREMVELIKTTRIYQSYANAIKSIDEDNSKLINGILRA